MVRENPAPAGERVQTGGLIEVSPWKVQFFLNHRRYLRSEDPSRVGKSPAELLTSEPHAHWLELLGCTRFSRT